MVGMGAIFLRMFFGLCVCLAVASGHALGDQTGQTGYQIVLPVSPEPLCDRVRNIVSAVHGQISNTVPTTPEFNSIHWEQVSPESRGSSTWVASVDVGNLGKTMFLMRSAFQDKFAFQSSFTKLLDPVLSSEHIRTMSTTELYKRTYSLLPGRLQLAGPKPATVLIVPTYIAPFRFQDRTYFLALEPPMVDLRHGPLGNPSEFVAVVEILGKELAASIEQQRVLSEPVVDAQKSRKTRRQEIDLAINRSVVLRCVLKASS